jgi:WD40 repeat protein
MRITKDILILGTCHGQVHVLSLNLKPINVLNAHSGMVTLLHVDEDEVYSAGDEGVLKIWAFKNNTLVEKNRK